MTTVLVCTLGGSPDPVVHAIQQNRADLVYFLASGGSGPSSSRATIEEETVHRVKGTCPHCKKAFENTIAQKSIVARASLPPDSYRIETIDNPDELSEVLAACERIRASIAERHPSANVVANYTGGTKSMSLGLGVFALRQSPPWALQVNVGARLDLQKTSMGDMAVAQDISALRGEEALTLARGLRDRFDYDGAMGVLTQVLREVSLGGELKSKLMRLRTECEMRAAWDRFDHAGALRLAEADPELERLHGERLNRLARAAERFAASTPWNEKDPSGRMLVEDLVENARCCAARKRYDDAVGRLYRATEILAQVRLRQRFTIHTGNVDLTHPALTPEVRSRLEGHRDQKGVVKIGLVASYELLADLSDDVGTYYRERKKALLDWLKKRNESLFAHGISPIDQETWNTVGDAWIRWIDEAPR